MNSLKGSYLNVLVIDLLHIEKFIAFDTSDQNRVLKLIFIFFSVPKKFF